MHIPSVPNRNLPEDYVVAAPRELSLQPNGHNFVIWRVCQIRKLSIQIASFFSFLIFHNSTKSFCVIKCCNLLSLQTRDVYKVKADSLLNNVRCMRTPGAKPGRFSSIGMFSETVTEKVSGDTKGGTFSCCQL